MRIKVGFFTLTVGGLLVLLTGSPAHASFDWGSDCEAGSGTFLQSIPQSATTEVGEIPPNKGNVEITLSSSTDVDIQLIDQATGTQIIAWPSGLLNGPSEQCTSFEGVEYCYSGYNGVPGQGLGHEWIRVNGVTNRTLIMKAYGYQAGDAPVDYSWQAVDTCNETGDGAFAQQIQQNGVVVVGDIPEGKSNVVIELVARDGRDVDIQLYDGGTALVMWPSGQLSGPTAQTLDYEGMTITYSGYNGIGGNWGREKIEITGRLSRTLTMKAFGYQSGFADVTYAWGVGAGLDCASGCAAGLQCKQGACHTVDWCTSEATAASDCAGLGGGGWSCVEFVCTGWPADHQAVEDEMLNLVNDLRATGSSCGGQWYPPVGPVTLDVNLRSAARLHAEDMGENSYFSHNGLDGSTPFDRMYAAGYTGFAAAENIAAGNAGAQTTFTQWVDSPGHCANMMSSSVNELGVGYARVPGAPYEHYWVQNFGNE